MSKITKFCVGSLVLLVVFFSITAFCLAAGGVRWGEENYGIWLGVASMLWLFANIPIAATVFSEPYP